MKKQGKPIIKIIQGGDLDMIEKNINNYLQEISDHLQSFHIGNVVFHVSKSDNYGGTDASLFSCNVIFYFKDIYTWNEINSIVNHADPRHEGWN